MTAWARYREKHKVHLCFVRCAIPVCITAGALLPTLLGGGIQRSPRCTDDLCGVRFQFASLLVLCCRSSFSEVVSAVRYH